MNDTHYKSMSCGDNRLVPEYAVDHALAEVEEIFSLTAAETRRIRVCLAACWKRDAVILYILCRWVNLPTQLEPDGPEGMLAVWKTARTEFSGRHALSVGLSPRLEDALIMIFCSAACCLRRLNEHVRLS